MSDSITEQKKPESKGMFDGPILSLLVKLCIPILASMIFQLLYNVVDTLFISRIDLSDSSYVGGVGLIFPIIFLFIALGHGLFIGVSSLVARAIGEKNNRILGRIAESGLAIGVVLSIVTLTVGFIWSKDLVYLFGARGDYYTHGYNYLIYLLPAASFIFMGNVFYGILQGEGLMKHIMIGMILGTVVNIALDPVFIFFLNMDVRGAAIATVLGQALSFVYVIVVFLQKRSSIRIKWKISNISLEIIRKIVAVGLPQTLSMILMAISALFFNKLIIGIDPLAYTAFALYGRFEQFVLMPAFAIGGAIVTIVGQNYGRKQFDRVWKVMKIGWLTGLVATLVLAVIQIFIAPYIYPFFSDIPTIIDYAVRQTFTMALFYSFALVGILSRSFFQGIGNPIPAFILTMLRTVLISLPVGYLFVLVLGFGVEGIWWAFNIGGICTGICSIIWVFLTVRGLKRNSFKPALHYENT